MSRRRRHGSASRPPQTPAPFRYWTIQRATGVGVVAGLAALLMAGLVSLASVGLLHAYALLLAATALCGASILWITAFDIRARGTSGRMRPIRGFDVAVGLALLVPALYALSEVWPELNL